MNVSNANTSTTAQAGDAPNASVPAGSGPPLRQGAAAPGEGAAQGTDQAVSKVADAQMGAAVTRLNDYVQNVQRSLEFSVDRQTGRTVIKVTDAETHQVIRQIPPEDVLALAQALGTRGAEGSRAGLLVQEKA